MEIWFQTACRVSPMSWDEVNIALNDDCRHDAVLCGIDWRRSSVGDLMDKLDNNHFRQLFHQSVSGRSV